MEINGKTYGFAYTVGAERDLARLCPGEDLRQLGSILKSRTAAALDASAEMLCILSRWHEKARRFEEPDYQEQPLTRDVLDVLPPRVFVALQNEAFAALKRDNGVTVESEPEKKGEAPQ